MTEKMEKRDFGKYAGASWASACCAPTRGRRVAGGLGKPHPYSGIRPANANDELVEEKFEKLVNGGEGRRSEEERHKKAGQHNSSGAQVMLGRLWDTARGSDRMEQAIDAGGEISIAGEKRSGEVRHARS